jgi:arylsulfatase A-like enzyme
MFRIRAFTPPVITQRGLAARGGQLLKPLDYVTGQFGKNHLGDRDERPFFCRFNSTRMPIFTHLKSESAGKTGLGAYPGGMVEHDGHVGRLLDKLDELGIADNTIAMHSTDNGAEIVSWPDGGSTPCRITPCPRLPPPPG